MMPSRMAKYAVLFVCPLAALLVLAMSLQVYKVPLMMGSNSGDGVLFGWVLAPWNKTCGCNSALPA
jgi:hypothetical protein